MAPPTTKASTRNGVKCEAGTEALPKAEYRRELVVERITKVCINHYVTRAMDEGSEREKYARMLYEADMRQVVELVGFALHPEWDWFGCSADGLCGEDGGVELKCPTELVHDSYCQDVSVMAREYRWQCIAGLICFPERAWWDLASFGPHFPDPWKLVKHRFHRAELAEEIAAVEKEALEFNFQIELEIARRGLPPTVFDIMPGSGDPPSKPQPGYENDMGISDDDIRLVYPSWQGTE